MAWSKREEKYMYTYKNIPQNGIQFYVYYAIVHNQWNLNVSSATKDICHNDKTSPKI